MKRTTKKLLSLLLVALMILGMTLPVSAATPKLSKKQLSLYVGQTYQLEAKNFSGAVKWSCDDKKIATVSKTGLVTAKKKGTAVIMAKAGNQSAVCAVTVKAVKLNKTKISLKQNKTTTLTLACGSTTGVNWKTSNKSIVKIISTSTNKAKIKGLKEGIAIVSAIYMKKSYKCTVTVKKGAIVVTPTPAPKGVPIDSEHFPDDNFRDYVADNFDTDGNSYLSDVEADAVTDINVSGMIISSLEGIEYFENLRVLFCAERNLTSLDISNNTKLERLSCYYNSLTSLDVSNNTKLELLICDYNKLTNLDVSNCTELVHLGCENNNLTSLDVSNNTKLERLLCDYNNLTSLDVRKNTKLETLWCYDNNLISLDVSKNTVLEYLYCYDNSLTSLDVSNCTALKWLLCANNNLTSLDVSNCTALERLKCSNNNLTSLDVRNCTALWELFCGAEVTVLR